MDSCGIQGSSSSGQIYKYDVFLSVRGDDTCNNFVAHLYNHLRKKGIFAFKYDGDLKRGEDISVISPQLLQVIKDSRVSIVVFSKDYAGSTWCLEELTAIAECRAAGQTVLPVFYDVDPSDVQDQKGMYKDAFDLHIEKFKEPPGKVDRWRKAMIDLTNLAGWDVREKPGFEEIEKIVQEVIIKLDHKFSGLADGLVGIQSRVRALEKLLKLSSENDDGFRVLGIWGMGGIGKTTHAEVLYDRISYQFDACCFIENVSKTYSDGGATAVQKQIVHHTVDQRNLETYGPSEIAGILRNRLSHKKVLMVLDNVDESEQLEELAINPKLLGAGSKIIITTRNKHILRIFGAEVVYKVPLLNIDDAYELLRAKAFKWNDPSSISFKELSSKVLKYAENLPLAIQVLGSFLNTNDPTQWTDAFDQLQNNPPDEIMNVLQTSFDKLKPTERDIFVDIACFFKGKRDDYVKRILDCCGLYPVIGIQVLIEKSFMTIREGEIHVHEMLQQLGKKIARKKGPLNPELWSRLWCYKDFRHVMMTETEAIHVKALVLDQQEDVSKGSPLKAEEFSKMRDLRLLILYQKNFSGNLNFLSNKLRYLSWHGYPFTSLPSSFQPDRLVELHMTGSSIKRLWEGVKHLPNLRRIDLSDSKDLETTPDFRMILNLEWLDLRECTSLLQVHPSIGSLQKLAFLSLRNCSSLVSLLDRDSGSNLSSLKVLDLAGCTKLARTPDFRGLSNLELLDLEQCTSLLKVDESIGVLTKLEMLRLRYCTNLVNIPHSISNIRNSLKILDIHGCSKLENPSLGRRTRGAADSLGHFQKWRSLIVLDLGFCDLSEVPAAIGELGCLERLNLEGNNFVTVPSTIKELPRLAYLNLSHCKVLQSLPELPSTNASSVGRYFTTIVGAHGHRSGLYIFNCPNLGSSSNQNSISRLQSKEEIECCSNYSAHLWLARLLQEPRHFRSGFDIVIPGVEIPKWFDHQLVGSSIRIQHCSYVEDDNNWIGVAFCVAFVVNAEPETPVSLYDPFYRQQQYPFYLAFEIEQEELSFDMPLRLDQVNVDGLEHLWLIYISRERCRFVKTGAHVKFKARPGVEVKKWGLRWVVKQDMEPQNDPLLLLRSGERNEVHHLPFSYVHEGSGCSVSTTSGNIILDMSNDIKLQLPYNSVLTEEEEKEQEEARQHSLDRKGESLVLYSFYTWGGGEEAAEEIWQVAKKKRRA